MMSMKAILVSGTAIAAVAFAIPAQSDGLPGAQIAQSGPTAKQKELERLETERKRKEAEARKAAAAAKAKAARKTVKRTPKVRRADARGLPPGNTFRDCSTCPEMVVIPPGSYMMGSNPGQDGAAKDEGPPRNVSIPKKFAVSRNEITFDDWDACVKVRRCNHRPADEGWGRSSRPVINVTWRDALQYAEWLSQSTGVRYRLLSEAEWEYVARAGQSGSRNWQGEGNACQYASVYDKVGESANTFKWKAHSCSDGFPQSAPVGNFLANGFGLYDMLGNVWEWTADCWNPSYAGAPANGAARNGGDCSQRVVRGGSWGDKPQDVRFSDRFPVQARIRTSNIGFRVAREIR